MANSSDDTPGITDADIDALLAEMNKGEGGGASTATATSADTTSVAASDDQASIDALLASATFADAVDAGVPAVASGGGGGMPMPPDAVPITLPDLQRAVADAQVSSIDLLRDIELNVKIELGRSRMFVEDVLKLSEGSVVELDKLAGDPVDVFVNERLVARGEVLVLNDTFCVRVNEIVAANLEEL